MLRFENILNNSDTTRKLSVKLEKNWTTLVYTAMRCYPITIIKIMNIQGNSAPADRKDNGIELWKNETKRKDAVMYINISSAEATVVARILANSTTVSSQCFIQYNIK